MKRVAATLLVAGLLASPLLSMPAPARAGVSVDIGVSVGVPPPPLPVYAQPVIPGPGYIWTPGYWAWDPAAGYYWVPGAWVMPPQIGLLWTPGWWGWSGGYYRWNPGYWGTHVGFYGGVNYGFGYFGTGYAGGYWRGNRFFYNRAVNNVNVATVRNVYVNRTVVNNINVNRVSYNGGRGGIAMQPTAQQRAWASERRFQPTALQIRQRDVAARDPAQRFNRGHARSAVFAARRVGSFAGARAVRADASAGSPADNRTPRGLVEAPRGRVSGTLRPEAAAHRPTLSSRVGRMSVVEAPRNRGQRQRERSAMPTGMPVMSRGAAEDRREASRQAGVAYYADRHGPAPDVRRGRSAAAPTRNVPRKDGDRVRKDGHGRQG